jgi:glycosyltransferase involved in cell wall biosynthesis
MSSNISKSIIEDYSCSPGKVACVCCGSNVQVKENEIFDNNRFSRKNILFVGLDWHRKGGPVLAEAFKTVVATYPDATLTVVGCKPRLDLPNCSVLGKIDLPEVKKYFNKASVFCLPTTNEPFGVVFLEAMAHKLPVVATNIGAIPDFIHEGKNGHLVDPNNSLQLSDALIKLLGSEEKCRTYGEYGSRLFWDRYTWEKTGLKLHDNIVPYIS